MVQVFAEKLRGINRTSLEAVVSPVLRAHGVQAAELSYQMEPGGWVLRVTVESLAGPNGEAELTDAPVDLGLLSEISRDLSSALDVADLIPHRYNLEVSSPGLDRPLRSVRDYQRASGRLAKVHLARPAADGQKVLRGSILESHEEGVSIEVDGKPVAVRFEDIERANLVFELPAHPKAKRPKAGKHPRH